MSQWLVIAWMLSQPTVSSRISSTEWQKIFLDFFVSPHSPALLDPLLPCNSLHPLSTTRRSTAFSHPARHLWDSVTQVVPKYWLSLDLQILSENTPFQIGVLLVSYSDSTSCTHSELCVMDGESNFISFQCISLLYLCINRYLKTSYLLPSHSSYHRYVLACANHRTVFTFSRHFCPKRLTVIHTMQGADQHIRSSVGFGFLPKVNLTCRAGQSNQQPSVNKTLALPLSYNPPMSS